MRTLPIPAAVLCLLTPLLALAQPGLGPTDNDIVARSPLTWYWLVAVAVAVVAFIVSSAVISRRNWPPTRRRIS
ncbi:hypothetical protein [Hyalangium versicolor]|uniref:hypothetical protein n=1 Tax=Hyalangium versicolor TaxID=2861190 RepID=UPI001CCC7A87|nr:hypothetical protein [Hyalangium versicolor]